MPLTLTVLPGQPPLPVTIVPDHGRLLIGRGSDCGLVLHDPDLKVSTHHCRIEGSPDGFIVTDISTNGTLLNELPLSQPHRLAEGDVVGIGAYRLRASLAPARRGEMNLDSWGKPAAAAARPSQPVRQAGAAAAAATATPAQAGGPATVLLNAAGLPRSTVALGDDELLRNAGAVLAILAEGLVAMAAQRARARADLGLAATAPTASAEALLARLLAPGGAAEAEELLAEADRHQTASLHAMQGALRRTLDALAPAQLRARTKGGGAALWQAYETAFAGSGSDPAFIERFAKEFASAYAALASPR